MPHADGNLFLRYAPCRVDNVTHAVTIAATPEVVDRAAFVQHIERENVRARQVDDVNVIANARTVRCRIVFTEDLDVSAFPGRRLQRDGDDVRLRIVVFATLLTRSGSVEIT